MGKSEKSCDCAPRNPELVEAMREKLPTDELIEDLAALYKAFGDSTRIKIVLALRREEMCVSDLAALLDMTKSAVSHQLSVLKNEGIVVSRRQGKEIYYTISSPRIRRILRPGLNMLGSDED